MKQRRGLVIVFSAAMAAAMLFLVACDIQNLKPAAWPPTGKVVRGSGVVATDTIPLGESPDGIALRIKGVPVERPNSAVTLIIDESLERACVITTDDNISQNITFAPSGADGEYLLEFTGGVALAPTELVIKIGAPVEKLTISGAWDFSYDCPSVTECSVSVSGAASGDFTFGKLERLKVNLSGAGHLSLSGKAALAAISISGTASVEAFDLTAQSANVSISGAGSCNITATDTLTASISGVGSITYGGNPVVTKKISGLGSVEQK